MDQNQKFWDFFVEKYGEEVTGILLQKGKLALKQDGICPLYYQNISKEVRNQIKQTFPRLTDLIDNFNEGEWAFDFPGWFGELNPRLNGVVKEIMVVGLEPHIRDRYYQVTYGLRKKMEEPKGELWERNNRRLWRNLYRFFKINIDDDLLPFLEKIYVTDLCHFAPKGEAHLVRKINEWKNIRKEVALKFLFKEMKLVNPKFIVSQGWEAARIIDHDILKGKGKVIAHKSNKWSDDNFKTKMPGNLANLPFYTIHEIEGRKLIHVALPHIASGNTQYFWSENISIPEKVGEELHVFLRKYGE